MAYTRTTWENEPSENTPINASNLNKIEQGIYDNSVNIGNLTNLNTTEKNNLVGAINEVHDLKPVILYNNTSGTTSNITNLNDDVSNYSYLEIFYKYLGTENSTKISGKVASLITHYMNDNQTYLQYKTVTFSGTTMTVNNYQQWSNIWGTSDVSAMNQNNILVTKILGYK